MPASCLYPHNGCCHHKKQHRSCPSQAPAMEHRTDWWMCPRSVQLLDLDQSLILNICRMLSVQDKLQLRLVSRSFQSMLDNPAPGLGIWGVVDLHPFTYDPFTLPPLYRWLLRCAPGIQSLRHVNPHGFPTIDVIEEDDVDIRQLFTSVFPQLSGLLSPGADIQLDLCWATAECLFGLGQGPHNAQYMSQYWGSLSSFLTKLKIQFGEDVTAETSSALNQLTQLQGLMVSGSSSSVAAIIHLQLPRLTKLSLVTFGSTTVSLKCPLVKSLKLVFLGPLQEMSKLPDGIETLRLIQLADGSVPLEQMLPVHGLKHLSHLGLQDCPGEASAVREAYIPSNLTRLDIYSEAWAQLLPSQLPWQALPCNLRDLTLSLPLDNGIPLVLEQLSNLELLTLSHVGTGPMHLTRPLDPFLEMASLKRLSFLGDKRAPLELGRWTPAARRLLGLAERRALHMPCKDPKDPAPFSLTY